MCILSKGIEALQKSDGEINRLIAPRRKEIIDLLERYVNEIIFFNPAYGLVGTNDRDELVIKHILDSLAPLGIISRLLAEINSGEIPEIADAGSGAGLPGIPLAIALPNCRFTLIERMGRRTGFLWNTKAALGLANVTVEEKQLEQTEKRRFSLVTFRAFKPLEPKLLQTLFSICAEDGIIAAYKGRCDKIEDEMLPLGEFCKSWEALPCTVPFLEEDRHLVVIRG